MKTLTPMADIYDAVASNFVHLKEFTPTHCDVRCAVNEMLESLERDGERVNHGYSQDMAFLQVTKAITFLLKHGN